jgi:t-SNARE complex subunit (syntaxin)
MQLLQAEDLDERLLQEREEEIVAINQSVVKVNEIFRDLGELVSRQQEDIDAIEQNVQHSHAAAKSGLEQVAKAAKYQAGCSLS